MGGVSSADRLPGGASAGTVEQSATAIQSCRLSTDTSPEVALIQKPEAAHKPVTIQQLTALASSSQIRVGGGVLIPPLHQPHEGSDNRSTAAAYCPFFTRTGNRNPYDVTQLSVGEKCYTTMSSE